jgi:hypothetical protein
VITVRDRNVSAAFAVDMRVIDVFVVNCLSHRFYYHRFDRVPPLSVRAHAHHTGRLAVCRQKPLATPRRIAQARSRHANTEHGCRMPTTPSKTPSLCGSLHLHRSQRDQARSAWRSRESVSKPPVGTFVVSLTRPGTPSAHTDNRGSVRLPALQRRSASGRLPPCEPLSHHPRASGRKR